MMHTRGRPHEWSTLPALAPDEVLPLVLRELEARAQAALAAGIRRDAIVLDPGFGFGKLGTENYTLLAHFSDLHQLGRPILSGLSRKGFLSKTIAPFCEDPTNPGQPIPPEARAAATQAANVASVLAGARQD